MSKIRLGIIGLEAGRSWAAVAHLGGLAELQDKYDVVGVANRRYESALAAAQACGIPTAYQDVDAMLADRNIDMVAVTVRVPQHKAVLEKAIRSGKAVYCEWPLAVDLPEAEALVALAEQQGTRTFIGTQALRSTAILTLKALIEQGSIGDILSHSLVGYGRIGQAEIRDDRTEQYLLDKESGATMFTISVGHTLAALQFACGGIRDIQSLLATRRPQVWSHDSNRFVAQTAADQVALQGFMQDGSLFTLHFRGGMPPDGKGFEWLIEGSKGLIRITALSGAIQIEDLKIELCRQGDTAFRPYDIPTGLCGKNFVAGNVARMYESAWRDITQGEHDTPDFNDALALHRLLDRIKRQA